MTASADSRRALAGAALLDFAVSPLFIWDVFTTSLTRELQVPGTALSVVISTGLAAFTAGVLAGGHLADAVAARRLAAVTGVGACAGLGTAAVAPNLPVLLTGFGVLLGTTTGVGYATAVRVAGTVGTRRGSAVAVVVSAYAAGAVVLAPVARELLTLVGRAGTFAILAGGLGALVAVAAALLPGTAPARGHAAAPGDSSSAYRSPVPALWLMFVLGSAPALVAFAHAGEFAGDPGDAVVAVSLLNAGNFAGRLSAGPACDRAGLAPALHVTAAALAGACVTLALVNAPAARLAALFVLGTQYGALSVLTPTATASSVPAARFGAAYGAVFSGWGIAGLAGPVAAAWLATQTGYSGVAGVLTGVAVLAWLATGYTAIAVRHAAGSGGQ